MPLLFTYLEPYHYNFSAIWNMPLHTHLMHPINILDQITLFFSTVHLLPLLSFFLDLDLTLAAYLSSSSFTHPFSLEPKQGHSCTLAPKGRSSNDIEPSSTTSLFIFSHFCFSRICTKEKGNKGHPLHLWPDEDQACVHVSKYRWWSCPVRLAAALHKYESTCCFERRRDEGERR